MVYSDFPGILLNKIEVCHVPRGNSEGDQGAYKGG
jgi:hypothetical protein